MARYIDADKLISQLDLRYSAESEFAEQIRAQPTADVVEVRHGKWELHNDGSGTCSHCKTRQKHIWDFDNSQNYCGRCGAKMAEAQNEKTRIKDCPQQMAMGKSGSIRN